MKRSVGRWECIKISRKLEFVQQNLSVIRGKVDFQIICVPPPAPLDGKVFFRSNYSWHIEFYKKKMAEKSAGK